MSSKLVMLSEIRNAKSGRIDAAKLSKVYGLSLSRFSKILDEKVSKVRMDPDSPTLQKKLVQVEKIAIALLELTRTRQNFWFWLNSPNPDLENQTPLSILLEGQADVILQLLEDALLGHPS